MRPIAGGLCAICGERLFSSYALSAAENEPRCGLCRRIEPAFARAVAYGSYEGGLRELIHLLKYAGVRPAANVLGRMLAEAIAALELDFPAESIPCLLYTSHIQHGGEQQRQPCSEDPDSAGIGSRHQQAVHDGQYKKCSCAKLVGKLHSSRFCVIEKIVAPRIGTPCIRAKGPNILKRTTSIAKPAKLAPTQKTLSPATR